jgi:hypothetical protein
MIPIPVIIYIEYISISTAAPYPSVSLRIQIRMTITFANESDVIVYALEKIISYAQRTQQIFVAQCIWWLASLIGLDQGLTIHIDNLKAGERSASFIDSLELVHPDRTHQILPVREVSSTPRDLTEDSRLERTLASAERVIQQSVRDRTTLQSGRVFPLPTTRNQLKKARKIKRLQEGNRKQESERSQRLRKIRATVIQNYSEE